MSFTKSHAIPPVREMSVTGKLGALPCSSLSKCVSLLPHLHSHDSQALAGMAQQLMQAAGGLVRASQGHLQGRRPPTALNKESVLWGGYVVQTSGICSKFYQLKHLRTQGNVQSCFKGLFLPCTDAYRKGKRHSLATSATFHRARLKPLMQISSVRAGQSSGFIRGGNRIVPHRRITNNFSC